MGTDPTWINTRIFTRAITGLPEPLTSALQPETVTAAA